MIGSAGFLGSALAAGLEQAGVPVTRYTRSVPFLPAPGRPDQGLLQARTVFWLASSINPAIAESHPERAAVDREAFATLLAAVSALPRPPRLVLLSSGGTVYDPAARPPHAEHAPTRPQGAYGRAKLELERMLGTAALPPGQAVVVRAANAYGPGQPAASIYGDPETTRDYVYVADIVAALTAIHRTPGELPPVLNVGCGRPTSLRGLAGIVLDVVGDPALEVLTQDARAFDVPHNWLDVGLAGRVLGWTPGTPLRAGIEAAWADARRRLLGSPPSETAVLPGASAHG